MAWCTPSYGRPTAPSPRSMPRTRYSLPPPLVRILDEQHLVARLVVEQLIHDLTHEQEAEAAGTQTPFFPRAHVAVGLAGRVANGRVLQPLRVEARTGVSDAIEQHAAPAQISDPHFAVGV